MAVFVPREVSFGAEERLFGVGRLSLTQQLDVSDFLLSALQQQLLKNYPQQLPLSTILRDNLHQRVSLLQQNLPLFIQNPITRLNHFIYLLD